MTSTVRERINFEQSIAEWKLFVARIRGVTPLLMHNPRNLMHPESTTASRKRIPTPEEEAELGLYRHEDGWLYVGADHLRESMLEASKSLRVNRKALRPLLAASLFILEPHFPLTREGRLLTTYDRIDVRRAIVQKQGVLRARPVIEVPWEFTARFQYDARLVREPALLVQVLQEAGMRVGLLDYRPQRGGVFGRYEVAEAWTEEL